MRMSTLAPLLSRLVLASVPLALGQLGCGSCPTEKRYEPGPDIAVAEPINLPLPRDFCVDLCRFVSPDFTPEACRVHGENGRPLSIDCTSTDGMLLTQTIQIGDEVQIYATEQQCRFLCSSEEVFGCSIKGVNGSPWQLTCRFEKEKLFCPPGGRRPHGFRQERAAGSSAIGKMFGALMRLEAASVDAFQILRAELLAHGAPKSFVAAAISAEHDEVRHAQLIESLMLKYGGRAEPPRVAHRSVRPLFEMAVENETEGCVEEVFGALIAAWQAASAEDADVRAAAAQIAPDELRHAELALAISAWARTRLSSCEQRQLDEARGDAVQRLKARLQCEPEAELIGARVLPHRELAASFVAALEHQLWSQPN